MNNLWVLIVFGVLLGGSANGGVPTAVEVAIEKVFVSPEGYDDNDNVTVVVHGNLPSLCFQVVDPAFAVKAETKTIVVRQFAAKVNYPECLKGATPKAYGQGGIFTSELQIGSLAAGEWKIVYDDGTKTMAERVFKVAKATSDTVDESIYAPVLSTFIPDLVYETKNAEVVLSGILNTSCLDLDPANIEVVKFSDVIVILPRLTVMNGDDCKKIELPLQEIVSVGELKPGEYLLHVRSMTGRSLNRVFKVVARPDNSKNVIIPQ